MLSTVLPWFALGLALAAIVLALLAFQLTLGLNRNERDFRALLLQMTELEDNHVALLDSHKRLRSRVGMRELRARKKDATNGGTYPDEDQPTVSAADFKKEMRMKLARGEVKPR